MIGTVQTSLRMLLLDWLVDISLTRFCDKGGVFPRLFLCSAKMLNCLTCYLMLDTNKADSLLGV